MIRNRLDKNYRKLRNWAEKNNTTAYRLYDRDIPEYPFIVDRYGEYFVIYDKSERIDEEKNHLPHLIAALQSLFQTGEEKIIIKRRLKQKGTEQYKRLSESNKKITVYENGVPLYVNLWDYLDTGLFLDHRPIRYNFLKKIKAKRFLNLFCYTASASVMAALNGATTFSIDMSANYLSWARENFQINNLNPDQHHFFEEDILQFIEDAKSWPDFKSSFDTIFLDPPTFSNSKKMVDNFEVERDQIALLTGVMELLSPEGTLYFSNNKRDFKIAAEIEKKFKVQNITAQTLPLDFHDRKIHHCFRLCHH